MAQLTVSVPTIVTANFLPSRSGLSTVGYTLLNADQSIFQPRTQVSVYEVLLDGSGYGVYATALTIPTTLSGFIVWDTGQDPNGVGTDRRRVIVEDIKVSLASGNSLGDVVTALGALMEENVMKIPNAENPSAIRIIRKRPEDPDWTTPYSDTTIPIIRIRGQERYGGPFV